MRRHKTEQIVVIDRFPQNIGKYRDDYAIVCIDVIRSTTTAVTAAASGRRCFPVPSLDRAIDLSNRMADERPLLAGETGEDKHASIGISNSPSMIANRKDIDRPLILLSPSGAELLRESAGGLVTFLACLRNFAAAAEVLAAHYSKVALIGAAHQAEFREEDQLCCAWIADLLVARGFKPATSNTNDLIARWKGVPVAELEKSPGAAFLRQTGQEEDLDFILSHVGDVDASFVMAEDEVLMIPRVFSFADDGAVPRTSAW